MPVHGTAWHQGMGQAAADAQTPASPADVEPAVSPGRRTAACRLLLGLLHRNLLHSLFRLGALLALLTGCGEADSGGSNDGPDQAETVDGDAHPPVQVLPAKLISSESLPALGAEIPTLDEGRLQLATPVDWHRSSRSPDYLIEFVRDRTRRNVFPRLRVTVEEVPPGEIAHVTTDNLAEFARDVADALDPASVVEDVRPLILGDQPCVRYVRATRFRLHRNGEIRPVETERQILITCRHGRRYTFDLQVIPGTIERYRDVGYALLARAVFHAPDPPATPEAGSGDADS